MTNTAEYTIIAIKCNNFVIVVLGFGGNGKDYIMKRKTKVFWAVLAVMFAMLCVPQNAQAAQKAVWKQVDGIYYAYKGKKLVKNKWVGDYYAGSDGTLVTNQWIGKYFVGEDGKWIRGFKGGWVKIRKKWYYYTEKGEKQIGWIKLGKRKYYLDPNKDGARASGWRMIEGSRYYFTKSGGGYLLTGWRRINRQYYYLRKKDGKCKQGWFRLKNKTYYAGEKYYRLTGWQTIDGKKYYFSKDGVLQSGWMDLKGKRYYLDPENGSAASIGLVSVNRVTYYFNAKGVMQKSKAVTIEGVVYNIDDNGKCTANLTDKDDEITDKMLFFTTFESGTAAYAQVGGDNGNACGKYQFDYRYSLLPFVKYCYQSNQTFFAEFKKYAAYTDSQKSLLKSNTQFYAAWRTIYNKSPKGFASYQDAFAKQEYYDVTEKYLKNKFGISMSARPDVVKGAVFSYSIQHGQWTAAGAVKAADIKNSTTDRQFLEKLYAYRMKTYPAYTTRYRSELSLALSLL